MRIVPVVYSRRVPGPLCQQFGGALPERHFSLPCHVFSLLVSLFVSLFVYNMNIPFMRRLTDASGDIRTRTDY